jgi:uncharacterized protein with PhoU and TrkA domain
VKGATLAADVTSRDFQKRYELEGEIFEATAALDSYLSGQTMGEAEEAPGAPFILGIREGDEVRLAPPRDAPIRVGAVLALMGPRPKVTGFVIASRLHLKPDLDSFVGLFNPSHAGVSELVVPPNSSFIGLEIGEVQMRKRFGVSVLAVHRGEASVHGVVRSVRVRAGDALIVHSRWEDLQVFCWCL